MRAIASRWLLCVLALTVTVTAAAGPKTDEPTPSREGVYVPEALYSFAGVGHDPDKPRPTAAEIAESQRRQLERLEKHMPVLKHRRGDRWPVLLWVDTPSAEPLIDAFARRGIAPLYNASSTIEQATEMLPVMKSFVRKGVPLIVLPQGWLQRAFAFPPRGTGCEHLPPAAPETEHRDFTCPGWAWENPAVYTHAGNINAVCQYWKTQGLEPTALILDYETGVYLRNGAENRDRLTRAWQEARKCPRCIKRFGADGMNTLEKYQDICDRSRAHSTKVGFVDPARQVFPNVKIGNFFAWPIRRTEVEKDKLPGYGYEGSGMDVPQPRCYFIPGWRGGRDQDRVSWGIFQYCIDRFSRCGSVLKEGEVMVPWVGYLWGHRNALRKAEAGCPIASSEAYREMAIHTMLRGAETIAIFTPGHFNRELPEAYAKMDRRELGAVMLNVLDIQQGYDEVLRFNDLLRKGKPITFEVPPADTPGPVYSGVATDDEAIVRTVTFGEPTVKVVEVLGRKVELPFKRRGQFFRIGKTGTATPVE